MRAHGGDPDLIPNEELRDIVLLVSDGVIGNKSIGAALASIGSGMYSGLGSSAEVRDFIPTLYPYIRPESDEDQEVMLSKKLITFAMAGKFD